MSVMTPLHKGRRTLILVALIFASPMLLAAVLIAGGWMPEGRRNYGVLIDPPVSVATTTATLQTGDVFTFTTPQWHWTLLVRMPAQCDQPCLDRLDQLGNLRISLGRHAAKLRIAINQSPPSNSVLGRASGVYVVPQWPVTAAQLLPESNQSFTLALVDPAGYLMMRYDAQADLARVRKDLGKLIR
jgi:hypothetical protein